MDRRQFLLAGSSLLAAAPLSGAFAQAGAAARIGYIPVIGTAPIFVANGEGWLKDAGLTPTFTVFESGPNMIQALASGTIDLYVAGIAPLAVARSRGVDIRVVAATAIAENVFVAAPALAKFFTSGTTAAAAFKAHKAATGKPARLATQPAGSVPNTTLQYWLWEVAKADKADVEVLPMGIDATQQAVLAGAVEGAIVREPALTIIQTRNPGIKLIAGGEELFPGQPGTVVAASGAFVTKNPDAVQKLVNSLVRAADLIAKSPENAAPHVGAALGKGIVDPELIQKALVSPASKFQIDPRVIIEPSRAMQAYQVKLGSLEKELPFDGLFETQYYERAIKAGG
ncbi:ABC transporter substrate-binding protein [Bosea lathyri]|uniref:NitT/TauT family transport system substrate-binding protein n=1 Tax=Bosea lathyri TaxID=1036778 RepID=A0A1H5ZYG9_9HYPH|nr:ABC transporter substrate-binding protein [Bosea lathyri]SEG41563.1 NitT/TauT family transport system substrate-binding protein [Bosea lathyri]